MNEHVVCGHRLLQSFRLNADRAAVSVAGLLSLIRYRGSERYRRNSRAPAKPSTRPRLLSIEIGGLGDLSRITPFREALRGTYPGSHLTVITHERNRPFFRWASAPDSLLLFKPSHRSFTGKLLFFLALQCSGRYDVTADFTGSYFSAWITGLSGARLSAGAPREGFSGFYTTPVPRHRNRPLADHYTSLLQAVGVRDVPDSAVGPGRTVSKNTEAHPPHIIIHPGSGWPGRRWPGHHWSTLILELAVKTGGRITVTGGPGEAELAGEVATSAGSGVNNLAGKLSFSDLAALLTSADLFISANVGPMHLARAVGCPTVTLFGPYSPVETGYPGDESHTAVTRSLPCSPCGTYTHTPVCHHFSCLREIAVKKVLEAALQALNRHGELGKEVVP